MVRLHASYGVIALYDQETNGLRIVQAPGRSADKLIDAIIPLSSGLAARAYDEKKPLLVERLLGATEPWESSTMVLTPLIVRDSARGILLLGAPEAGDPVLNSSAGVRARARR